MLRHLPLANNKRRAVAEFLRSHLLLESCKREYGYGFLADKKSPIVCHCGTHGVSNNATEVALMTRGPHRRAWAPLLWASAGAAVTLLAVALWNDGGDAPAIRERDEIRAISAPTPPAGPARGTAPTREALEAVEQHSAPAAATRSADTRGPAPAGNPIVADAPPSNSPGIRTDLPGRHNDDPAGSAPAAQLLDSPRISCDFGAGNNTGIRVGELLTVGGGAQWMGGLILYDMTDESAGTARMIGSPGATGSPSGEAKVQVVTEGTRVFLSGFLGNRGYVVVTIYDELDNVGRHIAVMSRHEGTFEYASQFLGTCE